MKAATHRLRAHNADQNSCTHGAPALGLIPSKIQTPRRFHRKFHHEEANMKRLTRPVLTLARWLGAGLNARAQNKPNILVERLKNLESLKPR
jgi:hypothetical protein